VQFCVFVVILPFYHLNSHQNDVKVRCAGVAKTDCHALHLCCADRKVLCLGIIQSLFEGSMYTFVLEWTPALTPPESQYQPVDTSDPHTLAAQTVDVDDIDADGHRGAIPHGFIFAAFMVELLAVLTYCWSAEIFGGIENKNLTIANRLRVSCTHNMSRASRPLVTL